MITNLVKEYRESKGLSQAELARRIGMNPTNLNAIENSKVQPWPKARRLISKTLREPQKKLFPYLNGGNNGG